MAKIAIAGASGFVGKALIKALHPRHTVRALGRGYLKFQEPGIEWRSTELFSASSIAHALEGIEVAVYLVHSMMPSSRLFQGNFHDTDLLLADNFAHACKLNGVKQIIYLGGLVPEGYISPHLQSRKEVEGVLQASGIPVTVLRAGMIVGPGGSSFEILRSLVSKLPMMILPKWTESATQAIFIDDVVGVIQASVLSQDFLGKTLNVVNGESLTYKQILRKTAQVLGLKRILLPIPIASTSFSKLWVEIFGNSTSELVSPLIDSLLCDLPQLQPPQQVKSCLRFFQFESMVKETLKRDVGPMGRPKRKIFHEDSVRSIQRLPAIDHDSHWLAMEYMKWLPTFFPALIRVIVSKDQNLVEFRIRFLPTPLLILKYERDELEMNREKFHIIGGFLTRTTNTGWLEFRQVNQKKFTLVSIHEFIPRLPWLAYVNIQAPLHKWVMLSFGKHLSSLKNT